MTTVYHIVNSPCLRRCYACLEVKRLKEFRKASYCKTGYKGICKKCYAGKNRHAPIIAQPFLFPLKVCLKCGIEKLLEEFKTSTISPDGYQPRCIECEAQKRVENSSNRGYAYSIYHGVILCFSNRFVICLISKSCTCCEQDKDLNEFYPKSTGWLQSNCKQCNGEQSLRWFNEHPEQVREQLQRRQADPEYIEYHRKKEQERYATIPAVAEYKKEQARIWQQENSLRVRDRYNRRELRKKGTGTDPVRYERILERDGLWCYICEGSIDASLKKPDPSSLVFDHVIPMQPRPGEPQGTHTEDNIKPTHQCCNNRKYNRRFEDLTSYDRRGPD